MPFAPADTVSTLADTAHTAPPDTNLTEGTPLSGCTLAPFRFFVKPSMFLIYTSVCSFLAVKWQIAIFLPFSCHFLAILQPLP
jgi:hypothetical protein